MMGFKIVLATAALLLASAKPADARPFDHFRSQTVGHAWSNAYLLALASHHGYRSEAADNPGRSFLAKFRAELAPLGLRAERFINARTRNVDTQAVIATNDSAVIVIFAGSESPMSAGGFKDWVLTDSRVKLVRDGTGHLHNGFHQAAGAAYQRVLRTVRPHVEQGRKLWLTGHSLGGALAIITAAWLKRDGIDVQGVYTYAAPRVGDGDWTSDYDRQLRLRTARWSNALDPVVKLPSAAALKDRQGRRRYASVGMSNVIRANGRIDLDSLLPKVAAPNPFDHRLSTYLHRIYRKLPNAVRRRMPLPPPACGLRQKKVGIHRGLAMCKPAGASKIKARRCRRRGGTTHRGYCLWTIDGKYRYKARRLKN